MKNKFLPKALDGRGGSRACLDVDIGACATEPHFHDCAEIIYIRKGSARVFYDCVWLDVKESEALLVPEGCIHCTLCDRSDSERVVIGFYDTLVADKECEEYFSLLPFLNAKFNTGCIVSAKDRPRLASLMNELFDMRKAPDDDAPLRLYSRVIEVLSEFLAEWKKRGYRSSVSHNKTVSEIKKYIERNSASHITASEVAREMNISYSYMARLLSEHLGVGFCDLLLSARIDMAKKTLTSSEMSVTDIGFECGFPSTSSFIGSFKKATGKTPLEYRRSVRK